MIRDFMPGECTLGPNAAVFNKIDQDPEVVAQNPQLAEVAEIICQSCVQLPHCETQRAGIVDVLSARGIGRTVVGGEIVKRVEPEEPDPRLIEPKFKFNLLRVPDDPEQRLATIRQGLGSGQLPVPKGQLQHHTLVYPRLRQSLIDRKSPLIESDQHLVSNAVARIALRYRTPIPKRNVPVPTEAEIIGMEALQDVFCKAFIFFREARLRYPEAVAQYHTPDFFTAFMERYEKQFDMTHARILRMFDRFSDPLTAMKKQLSADRQLREAVNKKETSEIVLGLPESRTARSRATIKEQQLNRYPSELQPYITLISRKKDTNHKQEVKALADRLRSLRRKHPDVESVALAYIAYEREDPDKATQDFKDTFASLKEKYENCQDCSLSRLQRFAFESETTEEAEAKVLGHLRRLEKIRSVATPGQLRDERFNEFIKVFVFRGSDIDTIDAQRVTYQYRRYLMNTSPERPHLKAWIQDRVVRLYDDDTFMIAAKNTAIFLLRGYLQVAFAVEPLPLAPYDRLDPQKGRHLVWAEEFLAFSPEEQEAILAAYNLDRLVLGRDADIEMLKAHFQTDDVKRFVMSCLLPYTAPAPKSAVFDNSVELLQRLRRHARDSSLASRQKEGPKKKIDQAFAVLLTDLRAEGAEAAEINSKACRDGIMSLLRRVEQRTPGKLRERWRLLGCVQAYLAEAERIRKHGVGDPYKIALGYSADFCDYFMTLVDKDLTEARAATLLERPTMQAMVDLRLFQKNIRVYEARFAQRGISRGYWVGRAFEYRRDPQFLENALRKYDTLRSKFPNVSKTAVNHFCFKTGKKKNSEAEIEDWMESIRQLAPAYKKAVSQESIEETAYANRGDQLAKVLAERIKVIDDIMRENDREPHPAIGREVVEYAVFRSANPRKWLKDKYLVRWNDIEKHEDTSGIRLPILRRLVLFDSKNPGDKVKMYKSLCVKYEGDLYITPAMIDEAIHTNPSTAMASLSRIRKTKQNEKVQAYTLIERGSDTASVPGNDTALSPEDIVVGKLEGVTREQRMIADLLKPATAMEKAVVAVAYNTSWLAPDDMRDKRHGEVVVRPLFAHYNVRSIRELKPVADAILKRLAAAKQ